MSQYAHELSFMCIERTGLISLATNPYLSLTCRPSGSKTGPELEGGVTLPTMGGVGPSIEGLFESKLRYR